MIFITTMKEASSEDGRLRFKLYRIEPGSRDNELDLQLAVECAGGVWPMAFRAIEAPGSPGYFAVRLRSEEELSQLLFFAEKLSIGTSLQDFLVDVAVGIVDMLADDPYAPTDQPIIFCADKCLLPAPLSRHFNEGPDGLTSCYVLASTSPAMRAEGGDA